MVAAGLIGGPMGALVGSVLTVLAGVVTGYVPSFRDEDRQRVSGQAETRQALRRASELPWGGPARLLDPRLGIVDFVGREHELARLISWCADGPLHRLRLVTGAGGVGKTRLSVELCARLEARGWRCVRIGDQGEGAALEAVRQDWPGEVLLVVDYAETRSGLPDLLRSVALDGGVVRVLLLARSVGEWWDRLRGGEPGVRDLLSGAGEYEALSVAVSGKLSNVDLFKAAVPVFAAALGVAPPQVSVEVGPGAVRVLDLHAAALVGVLRSVDQKAPVSVSVRGVLDELLGHEERFWVGAAEQQGLLSGTGGMMVGTLRQIVAAGALLGAASQDEALELLARVPEAVRSVKVASWLRDLYPPDAEPSQSDGTEWLGALRPDRLAEHLVVAQLTASQELAERCLTNLGRRQVLRAMTLLGRAAADQQTAARKLLVRILPLLESVVAGLPADIGLLTAISDAIPDPWPALAEADLAVTQRILLILPPGELALRARWMNSLSALLAETGRLAEALPTAQQVVEILRELAAADPDRHRGNLATSLSNLGIRFSELGCPAEALPVTQEAVEIRRELAAAYPDRYRPDLADSLINLGSQLSELGRPAEALSVALEAVGIRRKLAAAYPDAYRPSLATSLSNLSVWFFEMGFTAEALSVTEEAVGIRRELAAAYPDRYRADLADSLLNLGKWFSELGRPDEALPVTQEAVEIRRELAAAYPDRYRADLAAALTNLSVWLSELGRPDEALPVTQEAVKTYRELAAANPERHRSGLAKALNNLADWWSQLGRPDEARPVMQEAFDIYRELAATNPERHHADLANSLSNLGFLYLRVGAPARGGPLSQEAVEIYRGLVTANPGRYRPDLGRALTNLGACLAGVNRFAEALPVMRETVDTYRGLAAINPDRYRAGLARCLANLGSLFSKLGRPADGLPVTQEALQIRRELTAINPARYRADLATALANLGGLLANSGRPAEGLPVAQEAVEIRRELAAAHPDRYRADLALALQLLATTLDAADRPIEAEAARHDAEVNQ